MFALKYKAGAKCNKFVFFFMFSFSLLENIHCATLAMQRSSAIFTKCWSVFEDVENARYIWLSSAKKWWRIWNRLTSRATGWVYREYAHGPAPPPWGKPVCRSTFSDRAPFTMTCWDLFVRYDVIHSRARPLMPKSVDKRLRNMP